jgi:hypothetical protein
MISTTVVAPIGHDIGQPREVLLRLTELFAETAVLYDEHFACQPHVRECQSDMFRYGTYPLIPLVRYVPSWNMLISDGETTG